jgi:thiol-disulfide isomerase/thioredoxin
MTPRSALASNVLVMVVVLVAVLVAASVFGAWWQRRSGRLRAESAGELMTSSELGELLGAKATLVQFSTSVCQPCRVTRGVLAQIATEIDGVRHLEIDAEVRLDLVRRLNVLRTPTVFVLDDRGRIVNRASGAPRRADMLAAVRAAVGATGTSEIGAKQPR